MIKKEKEPTKEKEYKHGLPKYSVKLNFVEVVLGGKPKSDPGEFWKERSEQKPNDIEVTPTTVLERTETGFWRDDKGIICTEAQIQGMLKEAGEALSYAKVMPKTFTAYKQRIRRGVYINPPTSRAHFTRNGEFIREPDKVFSLVKTNIGYPPRSSIGRHDGLVAKLIRKEPDAMHKEKVESLPKGVQLQFVLACDTITENNLLMLLERAELIGLGAMRTQGYGKFQLEEFEPIQ